MTASQGLWWLRCGNTHVGAAVPSFILPTACHKTSLGIQDNWSPDDLLWLLGHP